MHGCAAWHALERRQRRHGREVESKPLVRAEQDQLLLLPRRLDQRHVLHAQRTLFVKQLTPALTSALKETLLLMVVW